MMNGSEVEILRRLAAAGPPPLPPRVDVAEGVLRDIRSRRPAGRSVLWPAAAAVLSLAAVVAAVVGVRAWLAVQEPLRAMFASVVMVMR